MSSTRRVGSCTAMSSPLRCCSCSPRPGADGGFRPARCAPVSQPQLSLGGSPRIGR
jgi:hypothetical protein